MDVWEFLIVVGAFLLAFRSLALLMTGHKKQYQQRVLVEEVARRRNAEPDTEPVATDLGDEGVPQSRAA
jgi:hypothetical protein